jgi:cytoskeletal protein CcmA (bactofilin family)
MRNFSVLDQRPDPGDTVRVQAPPMSPPPHAPAPAAAAAKKIAVLGPTLRFKGELSAEEDFILQGRIEGSINHTQSVTIGTDGSVLGNIQARRITIEGTVEGDLHGSESVTVQETGRVTGNIYAPRVGIVEGATFNGRVEMVSTRSSASAGSRREAQPGVPLSAEETERMLGQQ